MIRPVFDRREEPEMQGAKSDNIPYISGMSDAAYQARSRTKTGLII